MLLCLASDTNRFVSHCAKYSSVNIEQPKQVIVTVRNVTVTSTLQHICGLNSFTGQLDTVFC
jgi:hypothetical protein